MKSTYQLCLEYWAVWKDSFWKGKVNACAHNRENGRQKESQGEENQDIINKNVMKKEARGG